MINKLFHIIATPRGQESRTLKVSNVFLEEFKKKYPSCTIDTINLFTDRIPSITLKMVNGKYVLLSGNELSGELKEAWAEIVRNIERFLSSDAYLISAPMWNFSIPYVLKHYIDIIVQPKYVFRYTEKGPEGLVKNRKMVIVTSRGGDYSQGSPFNSYDYQEPYLRAVFGFIGIADITFINAQPMDASGPEVQKEKIQNAQEQARKIVKGF